jgi:hypothetical protein
MAGKLKRRAETETLTFEVFDLDLDDDDRQRLSDDPRGFLSNLLQEEGATVNGLMLESDEEYKTSDGNGALGLEAWHIRSGPAKSGWLIPRVLV